MQIFYSRRERRSERKGAGESKRLGILTAALMMFSCTYSVLHTSPGQIFVVQGKIRYIREESRSRE